MSGTSVDGIDAALVEIDGAGYDLTLTLVAGESRSYRASLQQAILKAAAGDGITLEDLASLDDAIALEFAQVAQVLIDRCGPVDLIASHGQTVFHRSVGGQATKVTGGLGYSQQLGRGSVIAHHLGLPTVSNFRQADIDAGGEGAPLVPIVDLCLLSHPQQARCVQNIGGIGNVTYLPAWNRQTQGQPPTVLGWDTGPGNSLIDIAMTQLSAGTLTYDRDGLWAAQGTPCEALITTWLDHPYFHLPPPKSTGRELFGWQYFQDCQQMAHQRGLTAVDLVATLTQFTAATIVQSYQQFLPALPEVMLVCGGGSQNPVLMAHLHTYLPGVTVVTTDAVGLSARYKEAIAFAVLGFWHWHQFPGNLPSVTGARAAVVLGQIHYPIAKALTKTFQARDIC